MCFIVDTCVIKEFLAKGRSDPLFKTMSEKKFLLVFGGKKLIKEYEKCTVLDRLMELKRQGMAKQLNDESINDLIPVLTSLIISNDPHIIALARISGARLLHTNDTDLIKDFKSASVLTPKGKHYSPMNAYKVINLEKKKCRCSTSC